jgi:hypothetical protein
LRAEVTAATRNDNSPDRGAAAVAAFPFTSVGAMVLLILSRLAFDVKKIGDGGAAGQDGFMQDVLQHAPQQLHLPSA